MQREKFIRLIKNLVEEYGWKKVIIAVIIVLVLLKGLVVLFCLNENKSIVDSMEIFEDIPQDKLKNNIKIRLLQTAEYENGITLMPNQFTILSALTNEKELISYAESIKDMCESTSKRIFNITIPKKSGSIEYSSIKIYNWSKTYKKLITKFERKESNLILVLNNNYIWVYMKESFPQSYKISIGNIVN